MPHGPHCLHEADAYPDYVWCDQPPFFHLSESNEGSCVCVRVCVTRHTLSLTRQAAAHTPPIQPPLPPALVGECPAESVWGHTHTHTHSSAAHVSMFILPRAAY